VPIRRSRLFNALDPFPPRENLVIEDLSDDDWTAFQEALAEA